MTDAHKFLEAIMDMATGLLRQHGHFDAETNAIHGPLDHISLSGAALDHEYREKILGVLAPVTRDDFVEHVRAHDEEGVSMNLSLDGDDMVDIFVPLTASVVEAHSIVKKAVDEYVEAHFG